VGRGAADRDRKLELQILNVRFVDGIELGEPLRAVVVMDHEPVMRLGIEQTLEGHLGGARRRRARDQQPRKRGRSRGERLGHCCLPCRFSLSSRLTRVRTHNPNTKIMVAFFARCFSSGELAMRPIWLRVSPVAMAMYCLPSTA